jgi:hypothetical protein
MLCIYGVDGCRSLRRGVRFVQRRSPAVSTHVSHLPLTRIGSRYQTMVPLFILWYCDDAEQTQPTTSSTVLNDLNEKSLIFGRNCKYRTLFGGGSNSIAYSANDIGSPLCLSTAADENIESPHKRILRCRFSLVDSPSPRVSAQIYHSGSPFAVASTTQG